MNRVVKATVEFACKNSRSCEVKSFRRCNTTASDASTTSQSSSAIISDVPGLTKNTVEVQTGAVGFPGASKKGTYKNPEYFCYHNMSYFEAEVEMKKYRLPQPSNKKK